jgi:hypothetical protein
MKGLLVLSLILVASAAQASQEVTGSAALTIDTDGGIFSSPGMITIRLIQYADGTISGGTDGGSIISLKNENGTWKGFAYNGAVELGCATDTCSGTVRSTGADIKVTRASGKIEGSLDFRPFSAVDTADHIEVSADGSITLDRDRDGSYSGSGILPTRAGRMPETFTATLDTAGTLSELTDPALFTIFLVTPFVRGPFSP